MLNKHTFKKNAIGNYELPKFVLNVEGLEESYSSPQIIQFMETNRNSNGGISGATDGILIEQLLSVGVDRLKDLNNKLPNKHTETAISLIEQAIGLLVLRDVIRTNENKTGTLIP